MEGEIQSNMLFLCTVCNKVFGTNDEALQHVCSQEDVVIEQDAENLTEDAPSFEHTAINTDISGFETLPQTPQQQSLLLRNNESRKRVLEGASNCNAFDPSVPDDSLDGRSGWTVEATKVMIKKYKDLVGSIAGHYSKAWDHVAIEMKRDGYVVTPAQCQGRWNVIKKRFERVTERLAAGKCSTKMTGFPYLHAISEIIPVKDFTSRKKGKKKEANEETTPEQEQTVVLPVEKKWFMNRKFTAAWTVVEVNELLNILQQKVAALDSPEAKTSKSLWSDVSDKLKSNNIVYTPYECEKKWRKMASKYKDLGESPANLEKYPNYYAVMNILQWFPDNYLGNNYTFFTTKDQSVSLNPDELKVIWSEEQTLLLLELMKERLSLFQSDQFRKRLIWTDITLEMRKQNHDVSPDQVESRWKTLRRKSCRSTSSTIDSGLPDLNQLAQELMENMSEKQAYGGDEDVIDNFTEKLKDSEYIEASRKVNCRDDKYPFVWTKVSIQTLFEILSGKGDEYKHARSMKQFYQSVAAVMREAGHNCHWEHLSGKVKTMRRAIKNAGSKNPSEDHLRRTVPYYDCVKDFLKLKRTPSASYKNGEKLSGDDSSDESGSDLDYESSEEEEESTGSMPWNHISTMALIMAYKDVYLKTKKSAYNSKKFWKIIQYNLKKQGFTQSLKACKGKFYKMRETFVRKARRASEGYGADKTWPFYDVMRSVVLARKKFDTKFSMLNASSTLDQYGWNTTSLDYELSKPRQLVHWDKDGMSLLVELIKERKPKFDNPLMYKKKDLWEEISVEVKKAGFSYNADSCDMKHKSLLRTYRATIRSNAIPGNTKKVCQFYSDFREMYPSSIVEPEVQKEIYKNLKRKRQEIMSQPVKVPKPTAEVEDENTADSNSVESSQVQADEPPEVLLDVDLNDFEVKEEELDEECALSDEDDNSSHASVSTSTVPGNPGKTSGMFDWLNQYEARQEKRETNIYKRMEKMQNETVTVMKDLISKLKK